MPDYTRIATHTDRTADIVNCFGLWTGRQFADCATGRLSITAAIYRAVTNTTPHSFLTDEDAALALITSNTGVMDVVRHLSASLDSPCPIDKATGNPDPIEHLERWVSESPAAEVLPPSVCEVIGRLHRAARTAREIAEPRTAA